MAEAAFTMLSVSFSATLWAMLGGFAWMLLFRCALPILAKWNTIGLMSSEAAARHATLRALGQLRTATVSTPYWN